MGRIIKSLVPLKKHHKAIFSVDTLSKPPVTRTIVCFFQTVLKVLYELVIKIFTVCIEHLVQYHPTNQLYKHCLFAFLLAR